MKGVSYACFLHLPFVTMVTAVKRCHLLLQGSSLRDVNSHLVTVTEYLAEAV